jgi:chromosome segregation protein
LKRIGVDKPTRLAEALEVDGGWDNAVETVLAGLLEGVMVDAPLDHAAGLAQLRGADLALIANGGGGEAKTGTLAAVVRGPAPVLGILSQIHTAASLEEARTIAARLAPHESVITADGEWFGRGYARVRRGGAQAGMLAREREIHALKAQIDSLQARVESLGKEIDDFKTRKADAERSRDDAHRGTRWPVAEPARQGRDGAGAPGAHRCRKCRTADAACRRPNADTRSARAPGTGRRAHG